MGVQHRRGSGCERYRVSGLEAANDCLGGQPRIGDDDSLAVVAVQLSGCVAEGPPIEVDNLDAPSDGARELRVGQFDRPGNCLRCDEGPMARGEANSRLGAGSLAPNIDRALADDNLDIAVRMTTDD